MLFEGFLTACTLTSSDHINVYRDVLKQARSAYYSNLIAERADCPTLL